jgi:hypothetical protein
MTTKRRVLLIATATVAASFAVVALLSWPLYWKLRPNVFEQPDGRMMFAASKRFDMTRSDCQPIGNWISTHQDGWKSATIVDFDPLQIQILCDNYDIQISENEVVLDYYKHPGDAERDDDSDINIRRSISPCERNYLLSQAAQIKAVRPWHWTGAPDPNRAIPQAPKSNQGRE